MAMSNQTGDIEFQQSGRFSAPSSASAEIFWPQPTAKGGPAKRTLDVVGALIALMIFLPLFVFVAIAIRLTSPGPVFYGHRRVGFGRRPFKCWKFRSMRTDADAALQRYLDENPELREEWRATRKLKNDPRVTPLGQVLRDYSVDELPQLINVLLGDMSFVGPRPVVDEELDRYGDVAPIYLSARPGITGLWQISGRSDTSYEERVRLDRDYVTNWSIGADVSILLRTVPTVIGKHGSY